MSPVGPALGPGAVYLPALDGLFRARPDLLTVAEIEPQTLWIRGSAPGARPRGSDATLSALASLPQHRLLHGVGAPIGGRHCDHHEHAAAFAAWAEALETPWVSEHLSVLDVTAAAGPTSSGFLMPPWQSEAGAALAAANIRARRAAIGKPFAFETGVSYFRPRPGEMPDGTFFAAVAEAADCGILLDLHNLWTNERNGRATIAEVIAALPLDRVWEVHLAGGAAHDDWWLDAHAGAIDPDLLAIAAEIVPMLPNLGAILFEIASDRVAGFGETTFLHQIEALHRLWERRPARRAPRPRPPVVLAHRVEADDPAIAGWEATIARAMLPASLTVPTEDEALLADDPAWPLYRMLVASFRKGVLTSLMGNSVRLLLRGLDAAALDALFEVYMAEVPPALYASDEALAFARWLDDHAPPLPDLAVVASFEAQVIRAVIDDTPLATVDPAVEEALARCAA